MSQDQSGLKRRVHLNLLLFVLIYLSLRLIVGWVVQYDIDRRTPWFLNAGLSRVLGWAMALYGLFWIVWWFFWIAIEGGKEHIELYGMRWAPVTTDFISGGPFEWLRYPVAFGYLEFLWGLGFLTRSTTLVVKIVPAMAIVCVIYLLAVVDRRRLKKYDQAYRFYKKRVPLIVPKIPDSAALASLFKRRQRQ